MPAKRLTPSHPRPDAKHARSDMKNLAKALFSSYSTNVGSLLDSANTCSMDCARMPRNCQPSRRSCSILGARCSSGASSVVMQGAVVAVSFVLLHLLALLAAGNLTFVLRSHPPPHSHRPLRCTRQGSACLATCMVNLNES